jgi:hypothetical protein
MRITYPNGTVVEALLLSRGQETLRVVVPGDDDTRTYTLAGGAWRSEKGEPVHIELAWDGRDSGLPAEAEFVCSKKLASRLMSLLVSYSGEELLDDVLWVFAPEGRRVAIHQTPLEMKRDIKANSALMRPN